MINPGLHCSIFDYAKSSFLGLIKITFAFGLTLAAVGVGDCRADTIVSGTYKLDPAHTSILFRINHLGFSYFMGRFDKFDGFIVYNSEHPEATTLDVTIYPGSIDTNDSELDEDLVAANWFDASTFPHATFHADHVDIQDGNTADVSGDFTLHGETHPLTLHIKLIGHGARPIIGGQVMGFSATTTFSRSAYGITNLVPLIGDIVDLQIDTEFELQQP